MDNKDRTDEEGEELTGEKWSGAVDSQRAALTLYTLLLLLPINLSSRPEVGYLTIEVTMCSCLVLCIQVSSAS